MAFDKTKSAHSETVNKNSAMGWGSGGVVGWGGVRARGRGVRARGHQGNGGVGVRGL